MSTLHHIPPHRRRIRAHPRTALALNALIAIGLVLLILTPTRHHTNSRTTAGAAYQAVLPAQTPALPSCFRDPTTHALTCSHTAPAPAATGAPAGYLRDPATHRLLRVPTRHHPVAQQPANHSRGRIIP